MSTICIASSYISKHALDGFECNLSTMCGHNCWYLLLFGASSIRLKQKISSSGVAQKYWNISYDMLSRYISISLFLDHGEKELVSTFKFISYFYKFNSFHHKVVKYLIAFCMESKEDKENIHSSISQKKFWVCQII